LQQQALRFQRERMRRIRLDFTLDADQVEARVRKQIPDLTQAEFDRWNRAGLFEHLTIDGQTFYFKRSPSNLFRLSDEARKRRAVQTPFDDTPNGVLNDHHRNVVREALTSGHHGVDPHRVEVTQTLTVDADAVVGVLSLVPINSPPLATVRPPDGPCSVNVTGSPLATGLPLASVSEPMIVVGDHPFSMR